MSDELAERPDSELALGELDSVLDDTLGSPTGLLDALSVFRPGKGEWFEIGDEKKEEVIGIFLISRRPSRACWASDEITGDSPVCWSINGTTPHELVSQPYSEQCQGCPNDQLGSGSGRSKKCKTKAKDFMLLLPIDSTDAMQMALKKEVVQINPGNIVGPAMVDYSIGNRGASRAYQSWQRAVREKGHRPQGVITKWSFGKDTNKAGTDYDFVSMEMVAPLPTPEEDPAIWKTIVSAVQALKSGQADDILVALSGAHEEDEPQL